MLISSSVADSTVRPSSLIRTLSVALPFPLFNNSSSKYSFHLEATIVYLSANFHRGRYTWRKKAPFSSANHWQFCKISAYHSVSYSLMPEQSHYLHTLFYVCGGFVFLLFFLPSIGPCFAGFPTSGNILRDRYHLTLLVEPPILRLSFACCLSG